MYKLISTLKKLPHLSADEFWSHWLDHHVEHVLALPEVKHYRINGALTRPGHSPAFDGVAEIWVETLDDARTLQQARLAGPLAESRARFTDVSQTRTVLTQERVILPEPPEGSAELKLCEVVYRRPDLTFEQFDRHWAEQHPIPVKRLQGLIGYLQHPAVQAADQPLPYDGHVMVWFDTLENARQSLRTPEGAAVLADEKLFVDGSRIERVAVREQRLR
jgi:uncharacterized protein (TIGR02118 family)